MATTKPQKTLKATYTKSAIGYRKDQKATVRLLGFTRLGQTKMLVDTPSVRGMLHKVQHLVTLEQDSAAPAAK